VIVAVWLSGENEALARAEVSAVVHRLGGRGASAPAHLGGSNRVLVDLPNRAVVLELAGRLALARRCAEPWPETDIESIETRVRAAGNSQAPAAFQWVSGSVGPRPPDALRRLGTAYRAGGGRIALEHPVRRFWVEALSNGELRLFEEIGVVDRVSLSARRTSKLPFQRPVTLAPKLARALVNLAQVGPGDRVVDPFVGTGSLLLEAALLGARTVGVDANATMVRGALENFAYLGQTPEMLRQADAAEAAGEFPVGAFDALITDPPYGRASGTRGEVPELLWRRALAAWTGRVRPGGRLAIVVPAGAEVPPLEARLEWAIRQRVHRSLTREFRVYVREPGGRTGQ
jgi:putative methyltransferase (TIGR01177 family)